MKTNIVFSLPPNKLRIGVIEAEGISVDQSPEEYIEEINADVSHICDSDFMYPDRLKKGVRSLLRNFGYQPSGRNRPASEFLVKDLINRGMFNKINNIVDINNHISLMTHLPISILNLDITGHDLSLRLGMENETYIFNKTEQTLSLKNLLLIAKNDDGITPFCSPVKDSHQSKIFEDTTNILVCIYTSSNLTSKEELENILDNFSNKLVKYANAKHIESKVLDAM